VNDPLLVNVDKRLTELDRDIDGLHGGERAGLDQLPQRRAGDVVRDDVSTALRARLERPHDVWVVQATADALFSREVVADGDLLHGTTLRRRTRAPESECMSGARWSGGKSRRNRHISAAGLGRTCNTRDLVRQRLAVLGSAARRSEQRRRIHARRMPPGGASVGVARPVLTCAGANRLSDRANGTVNAGRCDARRLAEPAGLLGGGAMGSHRWFDAALHPAPVRL